ncbi:cation:proton antiporter [Neisseria sp. Ec49-e6-T10]|uniref:cation:proton antiporter n=1 Tax=Neisseria sp. Ec49-e6-T10 TaxID=3140744 RepID=UPI003EBB98CC
MLQLFAIFICATTLLAVVNYRFLGLPSTIGVMVVALLASLAMQLLDYFGFSGVGHEVELLMHKIDFNDLLMNWMLGFLLFAGALHVNLKDLKAYLMPIGILSTVGVVMSTLLIGYFSYWLFDFMGMHINIWYCMVFGALISPTDPIAVLGILRSAGAPKSLEMTIVGESLFNDGVAVVLFSVILGIIHVGSTPTIQAGLGLFLHEAGGGVILGGLLGVASYLLMRKIDDYQIEVMLTLAVVIGGSTLASTFHVSGPIAMVVAGLIIGNPIRKYIMSDTSRRYLDDFWELLDSMLNALLFALIGMEILILPFDLQHVIAAGILILLVLFARWLTVSPVVFFSPKWRKVSRGTKAILTWGALRGGVSVALALSLPLGPERELIITITYIIVLASILIQGLSIGKLVKRVAGKTDNTLEV